MSDRNRGSGQRGQEDGHSGRPAGPSYRLTAARELDRIERDDAYVGFARRGRGGDPAFERSVTDVVAGVTRYRRYLDFLINTFYRGDPNGLETEYGRCSGSDCSNCCILGPPITR